MSLPAKYVDYVDAGSLQMQEVKNDKETFRGVYKRMGNKHY